MENYSQIMTAMEGAISLYEDESLKDSSTKHTNMYIHMYTHI